MRPAGGAVLPTLAAFARGAFQRQLAYRMANWAGLFTNLCFLLFRAWVLRACYTARTDIGGLSVEEAATYVVVTQAILMVSPQWRDLGVGSSVQSGQIAVDLLRPIDFVAMTFAREAGVSAYYLLLRMLPLLALGAVAGWLHAPPSASAALGFAVSLLLGSVIAIAVLLIVELSSFWLETHRGVRLVVLSASLLPSGLIVPVAWFPPVLELVSRLTPFPYTLYVPAEIWAGEVAGAALLGTLAVQAVWAGVLVGTCRLVFALGTHRLQVLGG
jgi:ABC-2 type transport system permease protein